MGGLSRTLVAIASLVGVVALSACSVDPALSDENSTTNLVDVTNLQSDSVETASDAAQDAKISSGTIVGNWMLTPKGGEDGRTSCGDFNSPPLYRLNGQTAKLTTFGKDGRYRSFFAYTTPSGEEHYTVYKARWSLDGNNVNLTEMSAQDAFRSEGGSDRWSVEPVAENVLKLNGDRYVRCGGPVTVFGDDEPGPSSQTASNAQPAAQPTCKSLESDVARLFTARTGHKVIEVNASDKLVEGSMNCTGTIITGAGVLYVRFGLGKTPKGQTIVSAIWSESPFI